MQERVLAALIMVGLSAQASAQKLKPVADVGAGVNTIQVFPELRVIELGGWTYFARDTPVTGAELFRVPIAGGAPALVADIAPGRYWPPCLASILACSRNRARSRASS